MLAFGGWIEKTVGMRGSPDPQLAMLTSLSTEDLIPADHPIRRIRVVVDAVLAELDDMFDAMYAAGGRRSVPPETLLKATVLMAMYSIRSERAFCERLNYDLLFKWFLDMRIDQPAFDATTFTKNRQRLLDHEVADEFFAAVVRQAKLRRYTSSSDHFSVDGTLFNAWASHKSFKPKDGAAVGAAGRAQRRSGLAWPETLERHARLDDRPRGPPLSQEQQHRRHALLRRPSADGAPQRVDRRRRAHHRRRLRRAGHRARACSPGCPRSARRRTVAGDKGYDTRGFVADTRNLGFTPHVAQNASGNRRSAIDGRTTRHAGHEVSMRIRKRIEEPFGWIKTIGGGRKLRYIGRQRNRAWFKITAAVYNLIRITALDATPA